VKYAADTKCRPERSATDAATVARNDETGRPIAATILELFLVTEEAVTHRSFFEDFSFVSFASFEVALALFRGLLPRTI
jgi:hypothetical protein